MKDSMHFKSSVIALLLLIPCVAFGQTEVASGDYGGTLRIAFDKVSKSLSGYYENSTGWDEQTKSPQFTCSFYFHGFLKEDNKIEIQSLSPKSVEDGTISGIVAMLPGNYIQLMLSQDPGGCSNVEQLVNTPADFKLSEKKLWTQVRYVVADKAYFHAEGRDETKQKAYILKGDVVYVEKVNGNWAYCSFIGKKVTTGWIKTSELNVF